MNSFTIMSVFKINIQVKYARVKKMLRNEKREIKTKSEFNSIFDNLKKFFNVNVFDELVKLKTKKNDMCKKVKVEIKFLKNCCKTLWIVSITNEKQKNWDLKIIMKKKTKKLMLILFANFFFVSDEIRLSMFLLFQLFKKEIFVMFKIFFFKLFVNLLLWNI